MEDLLDDRKCTAYRLKIHDRGCTHPGGWRTDFSTYMMVQEYFWMPMQVGSQGMYPNGPPESAVRYISTQFRGGEISNQSMAEHQSIVLAHTTVEGGGQESLVMELDTTSILLPVDNAAVRVRIQQRIAEIDREMAHAPSAGDNFSLQLARSKLERELTLFQS